MSEHVSEHSPAPLMIAVLAASGGSREAETQPTAAPPVVEVVPVAETDVPIYGEWVGTTVGYITAQIRAQKALGGGRQSHPAAGPRPAP